MCGILGTINLPIDTATLDLIRHRGPDGHGLIEKTSGHHRVRLGHRRLSIVDLSERGAQPMSTPDGRYHLIFNGEIYNHQDIRPSLSNRQFRGHSDTETLLHAFAESGVECLSKLNGIFAFGILDVPNARVYLVRDQYGVKPVYYASGTGSFSFASEMAPLRAQMDCDVDMQGLATLLKLRFVPSPNTMYEGIKRLRPGHVLEIDLGKTTLSTREYPFVGPIAASDRSPPSFESALEEYGRLFQDAVSRQLMSDVDVGVFLSGGIDSALIATAANSASDRPLKAFTVGFNEASANGVDEIDDAAHTARYLGIEHFATRMGFDDFLEVLRDCVQIVEEPLATTSIVPMHFLAKLAGEHVKVVLSGQGADELLGGYQRYQVELWRRLIPPLLASAGTSVAGALGIKNDAVLRGLRSLRQSDDISRFIDVYSVFSNDEILRLTGVARGDEREQIEYYYDLLNCANLPTSAERMMSVDARLGLPDDLLLYTDKITMRQSLECRVPFLDIALAGYVETLPRSYRLKLSRTKIIHKAYARKTLPSSIVHRPKKGFLSPTHHWFQNESVLRSLLLDKSSRFANHCDLSVVEQVIREHQLGYNRERQIFLLLSLYYCLQYETPASTAQEREVNLATVN